MLTRRIAIDTLRVRRALPVDPDTLLDLVAAEHGSPEPAAVHSDEISRVRAALSTLPREQQRAVILSAFGALTAVEVAEIEQIPVGTAKTRLRLGLSRLRSQLLAEETHDL
jgi:RNA polymerase sigma-70 factor (ECF subfamily)